MYPTNGLLVWIRWMTPSMPVIVGAAKVQEVQVLTEVVATPSREAVVPTGGSIS